MVGIAPAPARDRWNTIYERIADCAPDALGVLNLLPQRAGRGGERKRLLISYLRHHMEELRPLMPTLAPLSHGLDDDQKQDPEFGVETLFATRLPALR